MRAATLAAPYASPEQAGRKKVSPASDVYSLGVVLYHALTLQLPFTGESAPVVVRKVLLTDPPDVLLILAWNFAAEIMEQQRTYAEGGGRFLIPVPTPELI